MAYYFGKMLVMPFEAVFVRTVEALKNEGFGIITEIDIKQTLKAKIRVDFPNYRILGASHPALAY